jgi:hypothetical protein
MSTTKDRIELSEAILALIEKKRQLTQDETLGAAIERVVIESQFRIWRTKFSRIPAPSNPG